METRTMEAKFPGKCTQCKVRFPAGTQIFWKPGMVKHVVCAPVEEKVEFMEPKGAEWKRAWAVLAAEFGEVECEENGEVWQYMATTRGKHEFRHRCYKGARKLFWVPARAEPKFGYNACETCGDEDNHDGEECPENN